MKFSAFILILGLIACSSPYKPDNSFYGRKVQQAYIDGCKSEAELVYRTMVRMDLVQLREENCKEKLKGYSQP